MTEEHKPATSEMIERNINDYPPLSLKDIAYLLLSVVSWLAMIAAAYFLLKGDQWTKMWVSLIVALAASSPAKIEEIARAWRAWRR